MASCLPARLLVREAAIVLADRSETRQPAGHLCLRKAALYNGVLLVSEAAVAARSETRPVIFACGRPPSAMASCLPMRALVRKAPVALAAKSENGEDRHLQCWFSREAIGEGSRGRFGSKIGDEPRHF